MSLLASASPWNSTEDTTIPKKRTSMLNNNIRKTIKHRNLDHHSVGSSSSSLVVSTEEPSLILGSGNSNSGMSIGETQTYNSEKQSRVHQMLDQITKVNSENDGSKLVDFTPPNAQMVYGSLNGGNALLPKPIMPSNDESNKRQNTPNGGGIYLSNETGLGKYTNYRMAHDPSRLRSASLPETAQYYGRNVSNSTGNEDRRLMEKINYMIHLLEEQQMEKTNNVMEEFVLYSLLGVFVIYVVDSFSRSGKYMR
jgi:hypothetical protein